MTVAFPWSGRDVNALVPISGRAAVPNTPAGAGFNWPSLVGRVSGYIRPVRGWGMSGLGQDVALMPTVPTVDLSVLGPGTLSPIDPNSINLINTGGFIGTAPSYSSSSINSAAGMVAGGASSASSQAPWWGNILAGALSSGLRTGSQIASYQLNPLYQKQTFYQTPQGAIYASNVGTGPGLTTGTTGSMLPILLLGGAVLLFMGMRR